MYIPYLFIHSSISSRLGCFHILAVVNHAAMNMGIQIYFHVPTFSTFRYIPRSENPGSYSCFLCFWEICHTIFHSHHTILHFHKQCSRVPVSLHLYQYFLFFSWLFRVAILRSMRWYLILVLICLSLIISDIEHLFTCLLAICVSLEQCLFRFLAHFVFRLLGGFMVCVLYCLISYHPGTLNKHF